MGPPSQPFRFERTPLNGSPFTLFPGDSEPFELTAPPEKLQGTESTLARCDGIVQDPNQLPLPLSTMFNNPYVGGLYPGCFDGEDDDLHNQKRG